MNVIKSAWIILNIIQGRPPRKIKSVVFSYVFYKVFRFKRKTWSLWISAVHYFCFLFWLKTPCKTKSRVIAGIIRWKFLPAQKFVNHFLTTWVDKIIFTDRDRQTDKGTDRLTDRQGWNKSPPTLSASVYLSIFNISTVLSHFST